MSKQALEEALNAIDLKGCNTEVKEQFQHDREMLLGRQLTREAQFYAPLFNHGKITDYLPENALLILDEPATISQVAGELDAEAAQLRSEKIERANCRSISPFLILPGKS